MAAAPTRGPDNVGLDEMIKTILADKGVRRSLGNPSAAELAKNNPEYLKLLFEQVKGSMGEQVDELKKIGAAIRTVEASPASKQDIYGFRDDHDDYPTYSMKPAEERPPGLPRANPVAPRPVGRPVSDEEKSREQWSPAGVMNDLKGYLPNAIGSRLEKITSAFTAGSKQAAAGGAGKLGQMAAGAGEAITAAGPVAVLAAAEVGSRVLANEINKFTKRVEAVSTGFQQLAGNDHMGMFNTAVDQAASELEEIPIVGKVYSAELKATVAPLRALNAMTSAFVSRGKELSNLSGTLAGANAQADVRSLLADVREAEVMGESLARLTDAQSRADSELRELLLPIKDVVVRSLAGLIEMMLSAWDFTQPFFNSVGETMLEILEVLKLTAEASPIIGEEFKKLFDEFKRGRDLDEKMKNLGSDRLMKDWLNAADNLGRPGAMPANNNDDAQRRINGPIFPGFDGFGM